MKLLNIMAATKYSNAVTLGPRMRDEQSEQKLRTAAREVFPALSSLISGFRAPTLPRHSLQMPPLGDPQTQAALAATGETAPSALAPWNDPILLQAVETTMLSHNLHPNRDQAEKVRPPVPFPFRSRPVHCLPL